MQRLLTKQLSIASSAPPIPLLQCRQLLTDLQKLQQVMAFAGSLYPVSAHDVVAGHALLKGAGGVLLNENGESIRYVTEDNMRAVSRWCFGGLEITCQTLVARD